MNIKMHVEYIGTNYCGWQKQANSKTIQDEIEKKLKKIYKTKITLLGSGRTDSGVHAIKQIANFHIDKKININLIALRNKLNRLLDQDIRIRSCESVDHNFHSQHSCKKKIYLYKIKTLEPCRVFEDDRVHFIKRDLSLKKLRKCASFFIGEHDFINFCKTGFSGKDTKRTIYSFTIIKKEKILEVRISGNGFLRGMVRLIIGALLNYEKDKVSDIDIMHALTNRSELKLNLSVPACGLYLYDVKY